jgi:hypothetical protein
MAVTNLTGLEVEEGVHAFASQDIVANGSINIKSGVVRIAKTDPGVVAVTLANPTAGDDDFKRLVIISNQTQANTVTVTGGFGNGGSGEDVATASGVVGDTLALMAFGGFWYIEGAHQWTIA